MFEEYSLIRSRMDFGGNNCNRQVIAYRFWVATFKTTTGYVKCKKGL